MIYTFEDFQQMEVIRTRGVAEVIVDRFVSVPGDGFEADHGKPVRLLGFSTDIELSDFEVLEQAYDHFLALEQEVQSTGKIPERYTMPEGWENSLQWDRRIEVSALLIWMLIIGTMLYGLLSSHAEKGREIERARSKMFQGGIEADRGLDERGMYVH